MKIGHRIRDSRIRQGVTLKELANKTGLTASFLSQLERDFTSSSVSSLEKIAEALNTKASYFFEGDERKELVFIKRSVTKKPIDKKSKVFRQRLASSLLNIKMHPQVFTLRNGAELTRELAYPEGEKFGMVLKGKIEFFCNEERFIFEEGDSIYCVYTQRPQKVRNIGKGEARFLWIVFAAL